jgi:pimeloyl-ACP methyl ester carboxylesterase
MILHQVLQLGLAAAALASPLASRGQDKGSGITWGSCPFADKVPGPIECGTLKVPLDYTNPESGDMVELKLSKVPASNGPSKGSILFNFGGPGYEAIMTLGVIKPQLLEMSGGQYDLVAVDPRGVTGTIQFDCFDNSTQRELANAKNPGIFSDSSDVALGQTWATTKVWVDQCGKRKGAADVAEYLGTAFVARDLMAIVDALGEDGLLRYWGISYGSVLGATAAAMFPDRMDRVVLDGVVNGHNYYHRYGLDLDQVLSTDKALRAILDECVKVGEAKCALAKLGSSGLEIETKLRLAAEELKYRPIPLGGNILDYSTVQTMLLVIAKYPTDVSGAAQVVYNMVTRKDLDTVAEFLQQQTDGVAMGGEALFGIKCSDSVPRSDNLDDLRLDLEYMAQSSRLFGSGLAGIAMTCAHWPWEAKERYLGDFNVKTRKPILFIGNTYDPVTPAASAYNMSASFEGSRVVEQQAFGHGSISQPSNCTSQVLQQYFADGTMPEKNVLCPVDISLFPDKA